VVDAVLSRHKQLTPISAYKCCEIRGGDGVRGLFVVRSPTAAMVGDGDSGNGDSIDNDSNSKSGGDNSDSGRKNNQ
jgi:hypothetical protein